jgi:hypothetical protein
MLRSNINRFTISKDILLLEQKPYFGYLHRPSSFSAITTTSAKAPATVIHRKSPYQKEKKAEQAATATATAITIAL